MRTWNVVVLLLVAAFVAAPAVQAQSDDDLRKEVNQLKADLQKVISNNAAIADENARLRTKVDSIDTEGNDLESRINALSESLSYAPSTTVNSVANPITFTGQFRSRGGWTFDRDFGADTGGSAGDSDDDGSFVDARFLVGINYELDRNVVAHFSMQSTGLYDNGSTTAPGNGLGEVDLYEGWVHVNNLFGRKEFSVRTGRQEVVLGNEFQFGNNDFFAGQTFDGTNWMWQSENFNLNFLWMKLQNDTNNFSAINHPYASGGDGYDDDELYSLYLTIKSLKDMEIDLYWIYLNGNDDGGGSTGTLGNGLSGGGTGAFFHTIGARIGGTFAVASGLDYNLEFAYQFGDLEGAGAGGSDLDVENFAVEAEIGITFNANNNFRVFVRFLFAEGGDNDESGYIPLFTERHANAGTGGTQNYRARYGLMDIVPMTNVMTLQGGLHFDPRADWTVGATFIWAQADEDVATANGMKDDIGFEIDLFADYRYSDQTTFGFGLGLFFADDATPLAAGGTAGSNDDLAVLIYTQVLVVF